MKFKNDKTISVLYDLLVKNGGRPMFSKSDVYTEYYQKMIKKTDKFKLLFDKLKEKIKKKMPRLYYLIKKAFK